MTTPQKVLIGAIVAAAVGTGLYEAHRASALQKQLATAAEQNESMRQQVVRLRQKAPSSRESAVASNNDPATAGADDPILKYIGPPIPPPSDMDPAFSKKGLTDAVQFAAHNAGITVQQIYIDDSEFPFLVGVMCQNGDWGKLKEQLRKLAGYQFNGSAGSDTCNVFPLVPNSNFPPDSVVRIYSRVHIREQMFYETINQ